MQSETKKNHTEYRNFLINKTHRKLALYFHGKYHGDTIEKVSKTCPVQRDATLNHPNPGKNLHGTRRRVGLGKKLKISMQVK